MHAQRLPDGRLVVPIRAEGPGVIGDSIVVIDESHPDYAAWARAARPASERLVTWAEGRPTFVPSDSDASGGDDG
jgi:hypothetical protein